MTSNAEERHLQAERLAAISQTVSGLAHESRNALQRIQSTVNRLRRRMDSSNGLGVMLDEIEGAGDEVKLLFEKVRTFAAPIVLRKKYCVISEIWRRAWDDIREERRGDAQLLEELKCVPKRCLADDMRLYQVFRNIFENALDASPPPVKIKLDCEEIKFDGSDGLCIIVSDNGPGFTAEQVENLFEPFYTTKREGTGLGLPLSKRIIEAHGGTIEASQSNPGGELTICLPNPPQTSVGNGADGEEGR